MQKPINLVSFLNGLSGCPEDDLHSFLPQFERLMSGRTSRLSYKKQELWCLQAFVEKGLNLGLSFSLFSGFAFSYSIPHISKEFDLLKVGNGKVLNIELKSKKKANADIVRQLRRNLYYLSFIGEDVFELSYCADDDSWMEFANGSLAPIGWTRVRDIMSNIGTGNPDIDFDELFVPSNYLVSPIMDVDSFLKGGFFLTSQQEEIKNSVLAYLDEEQVGGLVVRGDAGTGKTLLLYDIALAMHEKTGKEAAIFHGSALTQYHYDFNRRHCGITILSPRCLVSADISGCSFVGFDEAHRMYPEQFRSAIARVVDAEIPFLVTLDSKQEMSRRERENDIEGITHELIPDDRHLKLNKKFRTNAAISKFIEGFLFGRCVPMQRTEDIRLEFAPTDTVAKELVNTYVSDGYQYISMSPSMYKQSILDDFQPAGYPNTHSVIGLEYESVVMVITDYVFFDGRRLCDKKHPNPNLLPTRLLYQGLTRARERIALVFRCDWAVFRFATRLLDST